MKQNTKNVLFSGLMAISLGLILMPFKAFYGVELCLYLGISALAIGGIITTVAGVKGSMEINKHKKNNKNKSFDVTKSFDQQQTKELTQEQTKEQVVEKTIEEQKNKNTKPQNKETTIEM